MRRHIFQSKKKSEKKWVKKFYAIVTAVIFIGSGIAVFGGSKGTSEPVDSEFTLTINAGGDSNSGLVEYVSGETIREALVRNQIDMSYSCVGNLCSGQNGEWTMSTNGFESFLDSEYEVQDKDTIILTFN